MFGATIKYESLLRSTRQGHHRRIAQVLAERFPEVAEAQPELLAQHYTESGLHEQAVNYWQQAGERAVKRSANVEANAYLKKGLELLTTRPESPERIQQELRFLVTLGLVLRATQGYAASEVEATYVRARALCQRVGETPEVSRVLWGLCAFYGIRGPLQIALDLGQQLLSLSNRHHDSDLELESQAILGYTFLYMGALVSARAHLEQARKLHDPARHRSHAQLYGQDPGIGCRSWSAMTLWLLGYPDQALAHSHEALTLAHELAHPFSLAFALFLAARFHQFRRDVQAVQEYVESTIALCTEQEFMHSLATGIILRGWTEAMQGREEEGLSQMRQGLAAYQATGAEVANAYHLALIADTYGNTGQVEEGQTILTEALALMEKTGDCFYEAEIHRLRGQLLLQQSPDNQAEAESCFQQSISIAQTQSAKSWELRAATSLARLWQSQGKRDEARQLLEPVYSWFTEGFDTADLIDAKALLDELS